MTKRELLEVIDQLELEVLEAEDPHGEGGWVPLDKPEDTADHYKTHHGIETIDFITANNLPFSPGNVIKYVARFQTSGKCMRDLRKAEIYLKWTRDLVERGVIKTNG